jgi:hypothetical protein
MITGIALILGLVVVANVALVFVAWRMSRPRPLPPVTVVIESSKVKRRPTGRLRAVPHRDREEVS